MAQYKVPQDVEADDKLLGPFSFRQFVYLLIAGVLIALTVGLFQLLPLLAIIPIPFVLFFGALALPIKKDQPMETYLAALVSYFLKPRTRIWTPGQKSSIITITAPKKVEESRIRDLTEEEATHRLSFLAGIVDTKGYAIKGLESNALRDDLVAEANATSDIFETGRYDSLMETINKDENERHQEVMNEMKNEIKKVENEKAGRSELQQGSEAVNADGVMVKAQDMDASNTGVVVSGSSVSNAKPINKMGPNFNSDTVIQPIVEDVENDEKQEKEKNKKKETMKAKPSIIELASNADFSVATIAKEANRIKERDEGEVFISLH